MSNLDSGSTFGFAKLTGVAGAEKWTNYTMEADLQYITAGQKRYAGLAYNVTDVGTHQKVGISYLNPTNYFVNGSLNGTHNWQNNPQSTTNTTNNGYLDALGTIVRDGAFRLKVETSNMTGTSTGTAKASVAPYGADGVLGEWIPIYTANNIVKETYQGTIGILLADNGGADLTVDNIKVYPTSAASEPETPAPATCKVTFNDNGHGTAPAALMGVLSGSTISKPADPVASGWIFGGWYKEAACTNAWDFDTDTVTGNVTLFAKWTQAYNADDGAANRPNAALKGHKTGDLIDHNDGTMTQILYAEDFNSYVNAQEQRITTTNAVGGWILSANEKGDATATVELKDAAMYITPGSETNGNAHVQLNVGASKYWSNYTVEADFTQYNALASNWMALAYNSTDRGNHQKGGVDGNLYFLNGRVNNSWVNDYINGDNHNKDTSEVVAGAKINTTYRLKIENWGMSDTEPGHSRFSIAYYDENGTLGEFTTITEVNNIDKRTYRGSIGIALSSYGKTNAKVDNIIVYKNVDVLYEEDFSDEASLEDWTFTNAGQKLENGKLYMNNQGNPNSFGFAQLTGVDGADQWDNYVVEADIDYVSDTQKRYFGLCYNFVGQENHQKVGIGHYSPYNNYFINGRLDGEWMNDTGDNHKNNPALGTIVKDGPFRLRIQTYNMTGRNTGTTSAYLARINADGSYGDWIEIATVNNITAEQCKGTIAVLLANGQGGAEITVDNVLVYKGETAVPAPPAPANVAEIYVPTTGIVNPPVVVQEVTKALPLTGDLRPGVAMMQIDKELNILSETGETLVAMDQWFQTYRYLVIPAFIVDSQEEADALAAYLKKNNIIDVYVMAEGEADMGLVTSALSTWHYARGGLILDEVGDTEREWSVLWQKVNADTHITQIVSRKPVSVDAMTWFNIHVTALWGVAHSTADVYNAIASGYHAVVSESPKMVYNIYSSITATTVSGRPQPIAHRGAHMNYGTYTDAGNNNEKGYPQNSREAFKLAIDTYGCLGVEADLHTTRDGVIFLEHDNDLSHYTNIKTLIASDDPKYACFTGEKGYKHENYTMEELRMLTLSGNGDNKVGSITSFEDALAYTEATGLVYYCHIGDAVTRAEFDRILTEHPEYVDNCVIFEEDSQAVAQGGYNWRDMSAPVAITFAQTGNATAALYKTVDGKEVPLTDLESLEAFIKLMNPWNAHPLWYQYYHHLREDFYYEVAARGYITVHSITTGQTTLNDRFLTNLGMVAALIEQPYMTDDYHYYVDAGASQVSMKVGEALDTTHTVLKVKGSEEAECGFVQLSGNILTYDTEVDGWTSTTDSQAVIVYYADLTEDGGATYRVYSKPVTVTWSQDTPAASSDATLSALSVTGAEIAPVFSADTLAYTASVDNSVTSVSIAATAHNNKAKVSGDVGEKALTVGENNFVVTVTAEDGTTVKNYAITITRTAQQAEEPAKLIIDQVYGDGGKGETPIANSFIEIYNPNETAVSLNGCTLVYEDKTLALDTSKSIPAKGSYLIVGASAGTTAQYQTYNLPGADQTCDWQIDNKTYTITLKKGETELDSVTAGNSDSTKVSKQKTLQRVNHTDTGADSDFRIVVWEKGRMSTTADTLSDYAPHNSKGEFGSLVTAEQEKPEPPEETVTINKTSDTGLVQYLSSYSTGNTNADGGVAEIVKFNEENDCMYLVSGQTQTLDIVRVKEDGSTELVKKIDIADMGSKNGFTAGDITSVDVNTSRDLVAIAVQSGMYTENGAIVLLDYDGKFVAKYDVGVQPDMITFTPDGNKVLTANEGEPREGYGEGTTDPKGSVTVADLDAQTANTYDFSSLDSSRDVLVADGVLLKKDTAPSVDLEPEFIAVSADSQTAYVTLQENNAVAALNLAGGTWKYVKGLGFKDHSVEGNGLDIDNDGKAHIRTENVYGVYMPDGISVVTIGGRDYLITANEGDAREWGKSKDKYENTDSETLTLSDGAQAGKKIEYLDTSKTDGLESGKTYLLGSRSFSIWDAETLKQIFESGDDFEQITAKEFPEHFNSGHGEAGLDKRSNKKGPEPETVAVLTANGKTYAVIGLERMGGIMVYDISDPAKAAYADYLNVRGFSETVKDLSKLGDLGPEGICAISAQNSPTGNAMLLVANEVSGTVTIAQIETTSGGSTSGGSTPGGSTPGGSTSGGTGNISTTTATDSAGNKVTVTTNKKTGEVTRTTKAPDGTTGTVVTDKNGKIMEISAQVSAAAAAESAKTGKAVTLPVEVPAADSVSNAAKIKIDLPANSGSVKVEVPAETVTSGTVAVIIHADGTQEIVKTSVVSENGIALTLAEDATVVLVDNAKEFGDTHNHWAADAIDFVTAREMFAGTSASTFSPNSAMTRAMLMVVLARFDDHDTAVDTGEAWYAEGMAWAVENGISDGSNPDATITREQLVTMLWRYAGSPESSYSLGSFRDQGEVADYAETAMAWAVEHGIVCGTSATTLSPADASTRAQLATILMRFCDAQMGNGGHGVIPDK